MSLKHGLLGLLNYEAMTGYDLAKAFDESLAHFWKAQISQIYRELNTMEGNGWLTSSLEIQTDKPNKKIYSITEQGCEELTQWLGSDMLSSLLNSRNEFLLKIFFSAPRGAKKNIETLKAFEKICEDKLSELSPIDDMIKEYGSTISNKEDMLFWRMTMEYGISNISMNRQWARNCIAQIERMDTEE